MIRTEHWFVRLEDALTLDLVSRELYAFVHRRCMSTLFNDVSTNTLINYTIYFLS